jgi:hypothetical protein
MVSPRRHQNTRTQNINGLETSGELAIGLIWVVEPEDLAELSSVWQAALVDASELEVCPAVYPRDDPLRDEVLILLMP